MRKLRFGRDSLEAGFSDDELWIGDTAASGALPAPADNIVGNDGINDTIYGTSGDDLILGLSGADLLFGGLGDDTLVGGLDVDELFGGDGNDTFSGGGQADVMRGGAGDDLYIIINGLPIVDETSAGSAGTDTIRIETTDAFKIPDGVEVRVLQTGPDAVTYISGDPTGELLTGTVAADRLDGAGGDDTLRGLIGRDALIGGAGDDRLEGGTSLDQMYGGLGNDTYVVDHDRDTVVETGLEELWGQDSTTGAVVSWSASVNGLGPEVASTRPGVGWALAGRGDFNADGNTDNLFRNLSTGENLVWYLDASGGFVSSANLSIPVVDTSWRIAGVGDFNGDERPDILWRNLTAGLESLWTMSGVTASAVLLPISVGSDWDIAGTADFNADGKMDILWRNAGAGLTSVWMMDGATPTSTTLLSLSAPVG